MVSRLVLPAKPGVALPGQLVRGFFLLALVLQLGGCAAPQSMRSQEVLQRIAADYRAFFPADGDPELQRDAGLLQPRFGLPAVISGGARFTVELLERGAPAPLRLALLRSELAAAQGAQCLATPDAPVDGCFPLRIVDQRREPLTPSSPNGRPSGAVRLLLTVEALAALPPRGYDLYLESAVDAPTRAPRSVWVRSQSAVGWPLRVAHLTDLHLGKSAPDLRANLERVLADVNAGAPDLVVVTGDLANLGTRTELLEEARSVLLRVDAPVVAIIGNHDLGFGPAPILTRAYGPGWANFARVFHPHLLFSLTLGDWDFVGFDSGPSVISPRVLTRGLADDTLAALAETLKSAQQQGRRGVVLLSHAPSRAALTTRSDSASVGIFGRMRRGAKAFERVLLDAAPGLQVIHLAGHTHWSDLFEADARSGERPARFHRWSAESLSPCLQPLHGQVSLITTQSASHSSFPFRRNGQGYGFTWLLLGESAPQVAFMRYHGTVPERCSLDPLPAFVSAPTS